MDTSSSRRGLRPRGGLISRLALSFMGLVALSGTIAGAAAATVTAKAAAPAKGGTLVIGGLATTVEDPGTLGFSLQSLVMMQNVDGTLFSPALTAAGHSQPGIASGYSFNAANTKMTITLRPGQKFADGTPINSAALQ